MSHKNPRKKLIPLSTEAFIEALKGKIVTTLNGEETSFLKEEKDWGTVVSIAGVHVLGEALFLQNGFGHNHKIEIRDSLFEQDLFFFGGKFANQFIIKNGSFKKGISFEKGSFGNLFKIEGGQFEEDINIGNFIFEDDFWISGGSFRGSLNIFDEAVFNKDFWIGGGSFKEGIEFMGGEFHGPVRISGGEVSQIQTYSGVFIEFSLTPLAIVKRISFFEGKFQKIEIVTAENSLTFLSFSHEIVVHSGVKVTGSFSKIVFDSVKLKNGAIYLSDVNVEYLWFRGFLNESKLDVNGLRSKISGKGFISIKNSDLGHAIFRGANFKSFRTIHISNSRLHGVITIGGYIPSNLDIGSIDNKHPEPERSAETYNQLTLAMQKQGNRDKEVEYYTSYLDWQRKAYLKEKKWSAAGSLWMHKISTEYGSSWIRGALLTIFVVSPLCYFLYSLTLPSVCCHFFQGGWQGGVLVHLKYFLIFLLPTHSLDFVQGMKLSWGSYALDIFGRILIGFMIYQTIAAFRRYGKI